MADPNVSTDERARLTYNGAIELAELVLAIREHAMRLDGGLDDPMHQVTLNALVDRVEVIANALIDVGMPQEDALHNADELRGQLRGLRKSTDEVSHA